jgi:predicted DNA-binding ribbon-helix-helix protein
MGKSFLRVMVLQWLARELLITKHAYEVVTAIGKAYLMAQLTVV